MLRSFLQNMEAAPSSERSSCWGYSFSRCPDVSMLHIAEKLHEAVAQEKQGVQSTMAARAQANLETKPDSKSSKSTDIVYS